MYTRKQTLYRLTTALLLIGAGVAPAAAQDAGNIALKAGINIANISQDEKFSEEDELQSLTGFMAGVAYSRTLQNALGYQVEALLTQKGNTLFNEDDDLENTIRLTYLEIPVLATAAFTQANGLTFRVHAGPTFAFRLAKSEKNHGETVSDDDKLDLKGNDVGLAIGGEVAKNQWLGGIRYTHGLTNIFDDDPDDFSFSEMKNKAVTFYVGYTFR